MSGLSERDVERLAEVLSWASGEMTRWSEAAHPDHNRWSWRGDGHGEHIRASYRAQVLALAPVVAAIRDEAMASAIRQFGNRMATPAHPGLDGPTLHAVWLEAQYAADALFDGGDL